MLTFVLVRATLTIGSVSFFIMALQCSQLAGIDSSVISGLQAVELVYVAVMFKYLFDENLKPRHIVGMAIVLLGVSLSVNLQTSSASKSDSAHSASSSTACAMLSAVLASLQVAVSRYTSVNFAYDPTHLAMDTALAIGLLGIPWVIVYWPAYGFTGFQIGVGIIAAIVHTSASCLANEATTNGLASPATTCF